MTFPSGPVIAIVAVLGPGLFNLIAVSIVGWIFYAKLIVAEFKAKAARLRQPPERGLWYRPHRPAPLALNAMTGFGL